MATTWWQLGNTEQARESYDRAVQWMDNNPPANQELRAVRAEAAERLGIPGPVSGDKEQPGTND